MMDFVVSFKNIFRVIALSQIPNNNEFPMERKEELVNEFHDFPDDNQVKSFTEK